MLDVMFKPSNPFLRIAVARVIDIRLEKQAFREAEVAFFDSSIGGSTKVLRSSATVK